MNDEMNDTLVKHYRIVTNIHPPFVMYDNVTDTWSGYCIDLLKIIQRNLKFSYDLYLVDNGQYGTWDHPENWNAVIRDVKDKKADMALSTLSVMLEREDVIDFTYPYYDEVGLTIVMHNDEVFTHVIQFLSVLDNEVWFNIIGAYFCTSILMWIFDRWSPYSYRNNKQVYNDHEIRNFTLKECLWFCVLSLTPQGCGEVPKNVSGRVAAAFWWLFGFIIIASYTAGLAAFLTVCLLESSITSIEDLGNQYSIQYSTTFNSTAYQYFERMADVEHHFYELWKNMSLSEDVSNLESSKFAVWEYPLSLKYTKMLLSMKQAGFPATTNEGIARVRNLSHNYAFIEHSSIVRYIILQNCDLRLVGEEFSQKPFAIAVQKGSPLRDDISKVIMQLLQSQQLQKLKQKWWTIKEPCPEHADHNKGIGMSTIGVLFIIMFIGIGVSCIVLLIEYLYYRYFGFKGNDI